MNIAGWIGWGIAVILGVLNILQYLKDKPIIKIEKNIYKKYKKFEELGNEEYAKKALKGDFNYGALDYEIRELIVDITNEGHRDAKLKNVLPLYEQEDRKSFSPKVINFNPITIEAGDRDPVHLFFEFPIKIIKEIEKTLPNIINIEFDFAHKKIKKKFYIGKK